MELNNTKCCNDSFQLYLELSDSKFQSYPFDTEDLGEQMMLVKEVISGYWKPRFLVDHQRQQAVEIANQNEQLLIVTEDDIDWETLKMLPEKVVARVQYRLCCFPFWIFHYHNGMAKVMWMINPEGRYYADSQGYGMTGDEEISLHGSIDRTGKVLEKFRFMEN